jgi:glycogen operon protein
MAMHYLINSYNQDLTFEIPKTIDAKKVSWRRWIDTSFESPKDICLWSDASNHIENSYLVKSHSIAILFTKIE